MSHDLKKEEQELDEQMRKLTTDSSMRVALLLVCAILGGTVGGILGYLITRLL